MIRFCRVALVLVLVSAVLPNTAAGQDDGWRTIEIETTEVTAPDVAITPDGESLIFTMLGKLFRLPVEGGEAEQLTFGRYYDTRPAVSPDGRLVAFQSDRDGSEGNIFLLELATDTAWCITVASGQVSQNVYEMSILAIGYLSAIRGTERLTTQTEPWMLSSVECELRTPQRYCIS